MPYLYHGTTKENADKILKEGFIPGTYFGKHLEDAINFGGEYAFHIWFSEDPNDYWEWRNSKHIPPERIVYLDHFKLTILYENKEASLKVSKDLIQEEHGDSRIICMQCEGRGQNEEYPRYYRWRDMDKVTVCRNCNGSGDLKKN